jgi:hypothetical protein
MCDLAGGVLVALPHEGPGRQLAENALEISLTPFDRTEGRTLRSELGRPRPRGEDTHAVHDVFPFEVRLLDVPEGTELSIAAAVQATYLDLALNSHPETLDAIAREPMQRLAVAPNWKLHPSAGVNEVVPEHFRLGAHHPNYLKMLGLDNPQPGDGDGITVAVLDNGYDRTYWEDVPSPTAPIGDSIDLVPGGAGTSVHGTLVAAIAAASCPGATIEPIRMAGDDSTEWDALHAIARAVSLDAPIITMTYGQVLVDEPCTCCGMVRQAARSAVFAQVVAWTAREGRALLFAAGNNPVGGVANPAAYAGAIPVTALDTTGQQLASFASWDRSGRLPVIAVPGDDVAVGRNTGHEYEG